MPIFNPPTADLTPPVPAVPEPGVDPRAMRLLRHYKSRACGRSVLKIGGVYQTIDTPTQEQINSATEVYLGGHVYTVSDATAAALTAAGYVVT